MAKGVKKPVNAELEVQRFATRLDVRGNNAKTIREGLDEKMSKEFRNTYAGAIEAVLMEYFTSQNNMSNKKQ